MLSERNHKTGDVLPPAPGEWQEINTSFYPTRPFRKFVKYTKKEPVFCEIRTLAPIKHGVVLDNGLMACFYVERYSKDDGNTTEVISPFDDRVLFDHKREAFKLDWQPMDWVDENGTLYHSTPSIPTMYPCLVGIEGMAYPAVWCPTRGFTDADNKPFKKYIEWWCYMPKPPERSADVRFQRMETD